MKIIYLITGSLGILLMLAWVIFLLVLLAGGTVVILRLLGVG